MTSHHPFFIHHQMPQKEGALLPLCRSSGTSTRATSPQMFVLWYQHPCHFSSKVRTLLTLCRSSGTSTRATSPQRFVLWYQHPCHVSSKVRPLVPLCRSSGTRTGATSPQRFIHCSLYAGPLVSAPVPRLLKGSYVALFMLVLSYPHPCHVSLYASPLVPAVISTNT